MSLSTNTENDSLARNNYYAHLQQQQQQQHIIQQQQYAAQYSSSQNNYNNYQMHQQQHQQQQQQQLQQQFIQQSSHHSQHSYQHQPLTNVFPNIYNDSQSIYKSNVELAAINGSHLLHNATNNNTSTNNSINLMMSSSSSPSPSLTTASNGNGAHYSSVQKQIQQDWSNREYIEIVLSNIKKLTDFLNSFELSCRSKLAILDEKLTKLERQIDYVEAKVTKGETLP